MRRTLLSLAILAMGLLTLAQTPNSFNYQAVVRAADGKILQNSNVSFRFSILEGSATGTSIYVETRTATTNQYGLVNLTIGDGTVVSGDMANVNWAGETNFLKIDMDVNGGSSFTDMSTQQLVAVPYAMHAATVTHSDNDTTNEYQDISKSGATISLSDGGGDVTLDDDDASNELQDLTKSGSTISLSDGGGSVSLDDDDATNELQTISVSGVDLTLSDGGGTVSIADNDNDASNEFQTLSKTGNNVSLSDGGGTVNIADNDNNSSNELQTISKSGNVVTLSDGGGSVNIADDDNDETNEIQDLTFANDSIGLTLSNDKIAVNDFGHWTLKDNNDLYRMERAVGLGTSTPNRGWMMDILSPDSIPNSLKVYNSADTNGTIYSLHNTLSRNSENVGNAFGITNYTAFHPETSNSITAGMLNQVVSSPDNASPQRTYGIYNTVSRSDSGNGAAYGTYNYVSSGATRGFLYGSYNQAYIGNSENTYPIYGSFNTASRVGGGVGTIYGSYSNATFSPVSSSGGAYGSYSNVNSSPDDASSALTIGTHIDVNRSDSGFGYTRALDIDHNHSGNDGENRGIYLDMDITGDNPDPVYGEYLDLVHRGSGNFSNMVGSRMFLKRKISSSNSADNSNNGWMYGDWTTIHNNPTGGSSYTYGDKVEIQSNPDDAASGPVWGNHLTIIRSDSGSGAVYGDYQDINHTGVDGSVYGEYDDIDVTGANPDPATANFSDIFRSSSVVAELYGTHNRTRRTSASRGMTYGLYNYTTTGPTSSGYSTYGIYNELDVSPASSHTTFASYTEVNRSGNGTSATYGDYMDFNHSSGGTIYGAYYDIDRTGTSTSSTYGHRTNVSSVGYTYGFYGEAYNPSTTTTGYNYGGYFIGQRSGVNNGRSYGVSANGWNYTTGTGGRYAYGIYAYGYHSSSAGTAYTYGVYALQGGSGDIEWGGYFVGNVYTSGAYNPSDAKLKTNINSDMTSLDRIRNLKVMEYEYDTDTYEHMNLPEGTQAGFLAHELADVFPELTAQAHQPALTEDEIKMLEDDGKEVKDAAREGIDFTAVNYAGLVPHLTKAIQEQQDMIEQQQALIELMQARIDALEAANESSNNE
ncbi:MAG: tail fiber domain-containing protein [Bacteroidia bacterium]